MTVNFSFSGCDRRLWRSMPNWLIVLLVIRAVIGEMGL